MICFLSGKITAKEISHEMDGDKGFTLIEIMVIISLSALILALVIPAVTRTLDWLEYDAAVRQLVQDIRLTQQFAVAAGRPVMLQIRPDNTYKIKLDEFNTFLTRGFPSGMRFKTTAVGQYYPLIKFNPDGVIAEGMGTIIVSHERGFQRKLTVQIYSGLVFANE
jgi:prepilin-type N-terminal cleavage/methylation domain-containing protein